ncbi:MAG: hypothetical protein ACPHID_08000 [Thermoplasmatota archaeon]
MRSGLVLVVALAGCLAGPEPGVADIPEPQTRFPVIIDYAMAGCHGNAMFFLLPPEALDALLPGGFRVRDASGLFNGVSMDLGKGVVFVASMECNGNETDFFVGEHAYSFVAILTEEPRVPHQEVESESRFNFYMPGLHMDNEVLQGLLATWQWPVTPAAVAVRNDVPDNPIPPTNPGPHVGKGAASVHTDFGYDYQILTPIPGSRDGAILPFDNLQMRLWVQNELGTGAFEYRFGHDVPIGAITTCNFDAGSLPATILGTTDCKDLPEDAMDQTGSALFENLHADARLVWLPGVFA